MHQSGWKPGDPSPQGWLNQPTLRLDYWGLQAVARELARAMERAREDADRPVRPARNTIGIGRGSL
jgi:hypothetical protein